MFLAYGIACYAMFFAVYAYFAGFVGNLFVPKSIDSGTPGPVGIALTVNLGLIALFCLQHSMMARPAFKQVWTRFVPHPIERSTYVLISNLLVILLMWQWQPMTAAIWNFDSGIGYIVMMALFVAGWLLVPAVSLMINHFDLFGTRQVWLNFKNKPYTSLPFRTPMAYKIVRHPLYVGWMLAFWATPSMSLGHFIFAATLSGYMIAATFVEERDLAIHFGQQYSDYQHMVGRFLPRLNPSTAAPSEIATPAAH
ncbi:MAG: isoprenylcysteine carboxylmethyltransferase family protein [Pirellulales bacterium]|nr:isoprenylcysteine carboxylmethyltransferase family protein [Pirellulales bacterium]